MAYIFFPFSSSFSEIEGLSESVNDKVVADKKKKLQETLTRILTLYVSFAEFHPFPSLIN